MGFRKRLFNRVESDAGFTVKIRAFGGYVEYREGHRVARIPAQPVMGKALINVYADTPITWNLPHGSDPVSETKRKEILNSIVDAMRFLNYPVEII